MANGTDLIFSSDPYSLAIGNCGFEVTPGNWTCGFNGPTPEDEDIQQRFEVVHYDKELIDEAVTVDGNGVTTLECHWIKRRPIKWCAFMSPSGRVFRPPSASFQSKEYSFYKGGSL